MEIIATIKHPYVYWSHMNDLSTMKKKIILMKFHSKIWNYYYKKLNKNPIQLKFGTPIVNSLYNCGSDCLIRKKDKRNMKTKIEKIFSAIIYQTNHYYFAISKYSHWSFALFTLRAEHESKDNIATFNQKLKNFTLFEAKYYKYYCRISLHLWAFMDWLYWKLIWLG